MNIAHIGLGNHYTDGMTYQDNQLAEQNARDGHKVIYVSDAAKYENGRIVPTGYEDTVLPCGVRLVRMPYERFINDLGTDKFRRVRGLYELLEDFAPDVILCHDLCYFSVLDVIRYRKNHPNVKFYADNHTAAHNSGANFLSLYVLHRMYYRYLTQKALPYLEKYLFTTWSDKQFAMDNYGVPDSIMEFFPLGGNLIDSAEYEQNRRKVREELKIKDGEQLYLHTGKLEADKKTPELLRAFSSVPELNARLAIIGFIPEDMQEIIRPLIEADDRIVFLGWKNSRQLTEYLCGCDLYLQPGGGSATMQNAVCMKAPVLSYPHDYYTHGYDYGNFIWVETEDDIKEAFRLISDGKTNLARMSLNSGKCAEELLDYRKIAARLYR